MKSDHDLPWYDPDWFSVSAFSAFEWQHKFLLYAALAAPIVVLIAVWIRERTTQKLAIAVTRSELRTSPVALARFIPDLLLTICLALLFVALARPQRSNERSEQWTEGIDIMLALDISQSMQIQDFEPNRLEVAKNVALNFVSGRKQDRIGIVIFSGDAFSLSPLTTDYDLLKSYISAISFDLIQNSGTAIGSAMAVMTNRMRESENKSKVCILLSDGENNAGNIDPITAAELGAAFGIKIYTILVGRDGAVPYGKDFFGNTQMIENNVDETTLRRMADIGQGEFFRATDAQALQEIFRRIDQYEKAEIRETRYRDTTDYYQVYLTWAIALFLLWLLLKSAPLSNVLQD